MMNNKEILVVKYGSSSVTNEDGADHTRLKHHAHELAGLSDRYGLVVVSSGAIAVGRAMWHENRKTDAPDAQTLATMGSAPMVTAWQRALNEQGLMGGQVLVTHREIDELDEGSMLLNTLQKNLRSDVVSIINENDALSDTEIAALSYGGDNDGLAAHVAIAVRASGLILLTEVDGLLDADGELITEVAQYQAESALRVAGKPGAKGRGGMASKARAALEAAANGVPAHIASADASLEGVLACEDGTTFYAPEIQYA